MTDDNRRLAEEPSSTPEAPSEPREQTAEPLARTPPPSQHEFLAFLSSAPPMPVAQASATPVGSPADALRRGDIAWLTADAQRRAPVADMSDVPGEPEARAEADTASHAEAVADAAWDRALADVDSVETASETEATGDAADSSETAVPQVVASHDDRPSEEDLAVIGLAPKRGTRRAQVTRVALAALLLLLLLFGIRSVLRSRAGEPRLAQRIEQDEFSVTPTVPAPPAVLRGPANVEAAPLAPSAREEVKKKAKTGASKEPATEDSAPAPARSTGPSVGRMPDLSRGTLDKLVREVESGQKSDDAKP